MTLNAKPYADIYVSHATAARRSCICAIRLHLLFAEPLWRLQPFSAGPHLACILDVWLLPACLRDASPDASPSVWV